ncbi:hypothetical protein ILYODFUR_011914 [Ilyodon furcidens]|uniref:Uncharacterized protein n=1 Tax=Ilyodon furcidens TaxID=33524 RepID=A0ABV0VDV2_9TELE
MCSPSALKGSYMKKQAKMLLMFNSLLWDSAQLASLDQSRLSAFCFRGEGIAQKQPTYVEETAPNGSSSPRKTRLHQCFPTKSSRICSSVCVFVCVCVCILHCELQMKMTAVVIYTMFMLFSSSVQ